MVRLYNHPFVNTFFTLFYILLLHTNDIYWENNSFVSPSQFYHWNVFLISVALIKDYPNRVGWHLLDFARKHSALSRSMFLRPANTISCKHDSACRSCATKNWMPNTLAPNSSTFKPFYEIQTQMSHPSPKNTPANFFTQLYAI